MYIWNHSDTKYRALYMLVHLLSNLSISLDVAPRAFKNANYFKNCSYHSLSINLMNTDQKFET